MLEGAGLFAVFYLAAMFLFCLARLALWIILSPFYLLRFMHRRRQRRQIALYVRRREARMKGPVPTCPPAQTTTLRQTLVRQPQPRTGPRHPQSKRNYPLWIPTSSMPVKHESNLWPPPLVKPQDF